MAESSLLKITSQKLVKPSSPTPPSSRYYKFSALDAYMPDLVATVPLFYAQGSLHGGNSSRKEELFEFLEASLSKILTYYYPFAGRFMEDNITVDCNDAGVQLWHVHVKSSMSEILNNRAEYSPWDVVILHEMSLCDISHVMIQLSYFECGGVCIAVSISHKLGDGTTMTNFINDWAIIARGSLDVPTPIPILSGASIFPPPNNPVITSMNVSRSNLVTQRFVFFTSSISELKRKAVTETEIKNPTQVEVVTSLIFRSLIFATKRLNSSGSFTPSLLLQSINFRPFTIPPLSNQMVGNFVDKFMISVSEEEEMTFSRILVELRKSKVKYIDKHKTCLERNVFMNQFAKFWTEDEKKLKDKNFDIYIFTSWFRFPLYKADFGFGEPIFVCKPGGDFKRTILFMANPSGNGIDAFITLERDQMSIFENDKELLAYASVDPIICSLN